jgi:hypothetical protein
MSYPGSYPQSWTLTHNAAELERAGHSVYYRGDRAHHDTATCRKCYDEARQRLDQNRKAAASCD